MGERAGADSDWSSPAFMQEIRIKEKMITVRQGMNLFKTSPSYKVPIAELSDAMAFA